MCGTIRGTDFAFSVSTNVINKVDLTHFYMFIVLLTYMELTERANE